MPEFVGTPLMHSSGGIYFSVHLKKQERQEQIKPKVNRRKEMLKKRAKTKETENQWSLKLNWSLRRSVKLINF